MKVEDVEDVICQWPESVGWRLKVEKSKEEGTKGRNDAGRG